MKIFLLKLFICFLLVHEGYSQVPYYDALKLRKHYNSETNSISPQDEAGAVEVKSILEFYSYNDRGNPYLDSLFDEGGLSALEDFTVRNLTSMAGPLAGIDVTTIADATARFMITRAKEELTITFFNKFRKFSEKHKEFQLLFPETSEVLVGLLAYQYNIMLPTLQNAFQEDAKDVLHNLDDVLLLPKYAEAIQEFPEVLLAIQAFQITVNLENGEHPAEIIEKYKNLSVWNRDNLSKSAQQLYQVLAFNSVVSTSIRLTDTTLILHQSVRGNDTIIYEQRRNALFKIVQNTGTTDSIAGWPAGRAWITPQHTEILARDDIAMRIFLGLIYQRISLETAQSANNELLKGIQEYMQKQSADLIAYSSLIRDFTIVADNVDEALGDIKRKKNNKVEATYEDYYSYINTSVDAIEYGFNVANKVGVTIEAGGYISMARNANNVYKNVYEKNYNAAVSSGFLVYETLGELVKQRAEDTKDTVNTDSRKESLNSIAANFNDLNTFAVQGFKFAAFIANMAEAESTEEVEKVIESAALPTGSSSLKKYQKFNIALNSYLGGFGRLNKEESPERSWEQQFGVTAPVGIAVSYGMGKAGSVSVFGNLFDIGAIAEFRLQEDTLGNKEIDEKILLGNIVSPGIFLVYGLPWNMPLSIGIGRQYGPGLFSIEQNADNGQTINNVYTPSWRTEIFLAVDIPLLNIYQSKKISTYK